MLRRQNWVGKLTFLLSALNLKITFPLTNKYLLSALQCKLKQNFVFALLKLILNFFFAEPNLSLTAKVEPSPNSKMLAIVAILAIVSLRWWAIINTKNYNTSSRAIMKTPGICTIKCHSIAAIDVIFFVNIFLLY